MQLQPQINLFSCFGATSHDVLGLLLTGLVGEQVLLGIKTWALCMQMFLLKYFPLLQIIFFS